MNKEYNKEEALIKESLTFQKSDEEIGMPDIEAELKKLHAEHDRQQFVRPVSAEMSRFRWSRVAVVAAIVCLISGLSYAAFRLVSYEMEPVEVEQTRISDDEETVSVVSKEEDEEKTAEVVTTLRYERATLEQIVNDLTEHYNLDAPEYEKEEAKSLVFHVTLPVDGSIWAAIEIMNHFGRVQFSLVDNHLVIK